MILGVEIEFENWEVVINSVDEKLKKFDDFTSPTYQLKGLRSVNDKLVLLKPKQEHFAKVLDFDWKKIELMQPTEL